MQHRRTPRLLTALAILATLVSLGTACGPESEDDVREPSALSSASPERRTYDPSPSVEPGSTQSRTIRQTTRARVGALKIGVISTKDGTASLSVTGAGIDDKSPQVHKGEPGDVITLDNGITITIDEVRPAEKSEGEPVEGGSTGEVGLTVKHPD